MRRTRIGTVGYVNAWPLTAKLDAWRYEVVHDHPTAVAAWLEKDEVDVALAPVVAVLNDPTLRIVPGVGICSEGPVDSVYLVGETPVSEWERVVLDGESRTSAILVKVLLAGPLGGGGDLPIFERVAPGTGVSAAGGRVGALVIGDAARQLPDHLTTRIDLAEAWTSWTGLPFVFAVWAGRPTLDPRVVSDLRDAARLGITAIPEHFSGPERDYLTRSIRYALDERALMGLRRFAALAYQAGLLDDHQVRLYGPGSVWTRSRPADVDVLLARGAAGERWTATEAARVAAEAQLSELIVAADLRRRGISSDASRVTYAVAADVDLDRAQECGDRDAVAAGVMAAVDTGATLLRIWGGHTLASRIWLEWLAWMDSCFDLPIEVVDAEAVLGAQRGSLARWMDELGSVGVRAVSDDVIDPTRRTEWTTAAATTGLLNTATVRVETYGVGRVIARLEEIRNLQDSSEVYRDVAVIAPVPPHVFVEPGSLTGSDWIRWAALSRLMLDNIAHHQASAWSQGPRIAQAGLAAGMDDFGVVGRVAVGSGARFEVDILGVERRIRDAGYVPMRRGLTYETLAGALTTPHRHDAHRDVRR